MIRPILALVALVLAAGVQGALTSYVPAAAAVFDFLLIVAIYYALNTNQVSGMLMGTVCGLIQDALVGHPIGQNAFAKTLIGYLVGGLGKRFELSQSVTHLLVLAGATLLQATVVSVLHLVLGLSVDFPSGTVLLARMAANGLVGTAIYAGLQRRARNRS
jgi:rod shape-determining protein MreD